MRLRVERNIAIERQVGREPVAAVDELRDVEEALSSQEVAVSRLGGAQHWRQQRSVHVIDHVARHSRQLTEAVELAALLRKADRRCDRLEDRRPAAPVIASQQRHRLAESKPLDRRDRRHAERDSSPQLKR